MMPNQNSVEYDIILRAAQALSQLQQLNAKATSFEQKVTNVTLVLKQFSAQTGLSMKSTLSLFKDADSAFAAINNKSALFGDLQKQGWQEVEKGTSTAVRGIHAVRIALGVLVSMLIFQVMAAIQNVFKEFTHAVREAELAVLNLVNAERRLSEMGIDISPKELQDIIDKVQELVPILSRIDAEELVSRITTNLAPALKLTGEEIEKIAIITGALFVKNKALGYSYDEVEKAVNDAFLTGKVSQGLNKFGVKLNDQIVKEEALRMGLVETSKEFDNLTGEMEAHVKSQAMINLMWEDAQENLKAMPAYMKTVDSQIERVNTAWSNLLSAIGSSGVGGILAQGLGILADSLEGWVKFFDAIKPVIVGVFSTWIAYVQTLGYVMQHPLAGAKAVYDQFKKFQTEAVANGMRELGDAIDTPTSALKELDDAIEEVDLDKLKNKIEDIIEDTANAQEDLATNLDRKLADLDEEYRRKALDAEQDYLRKIEDINRDAERDIRDIKEKQREEDIRDEEKYQLQLWELRMRFLMNLEDALHARDARQVLRLQKQYAIDKEALERKHALDNKEREQNQRDELEDAEQRKQERLEDARLEYQEKLADLNIAKQREQQDLQTWYEREQADIVLAQQRKLETLLKGWMDEKKITEANAAEVYGILLKYFGPGGMTDELYKYMAQSLAANTVNAINGVLSQLGSIGGGVGGGGFTSPLPSNNSGGSAPVFDHVREGSGRSVGDSLLATRPTTSILGESGLSNLTPMSRVGKNAGQSFGDSSGGGGVNGTIRVAVDLSPDLTGRIVEQSLDGVAEVLSKVNRSKI
jgi:hypothetical protein